MRQILIALLLIACLPLYGQQQRDILGEGFSAETFEMGCDYSGRVRSTIVRTLPIVEGRDAILYIHGYNDYFFQADMARRFHDSCYNFYAVDLRRYGRSLTEDQTPFEVRDLREYFDDIDNAIEIVKNEGAARVILMGHSTGGLIATYYIGSKEGAHSIDGLILNSPFFAQNVGWALREVAIPIISALGRYFPDIEVLEDGSPTYYESLHKDCHGEWEYDTSLKMPYSPPITMGWLRAIDLAQREIQDGYTLEIPALVLYSDKSFIGREWSAEFQISDTVLNVEDIAKYGQGLGELATLFEIEGGMHDIILSGYDVREKAYTAIFDWLNYTLPQH